MTGTETRGRPRAIARNPGHLSGYLLRHVHYRRNAGQWKLTMTRLRLAQVVIRGKQDLQRR